MSDTTQQARNDLRKMFNDQESGRWLYDTYISIDLAGDFACAIVKLINDREAALREELAEKQASSEMFYQKQRLAETKQANAERKLKTAEQRNAELVELLRDSYPTMNCYNSAAKSDIRDRIDAALKPTESGASE